MKKAPIFILVISFIISIFLISYFGLAIRSDQMKIYIDSVQFLDCEVVGEGEEAFKYKTIEFNEDADNVYFMQYSISPAQATEQDGYEFKIVDGNGTFIDEITGEEVPYAEIYMNKVIFYCPCSITVMLASNDGSGKTDYVLLICVSLEQEEETI